MSDLDDIIGSLAKKYSGDMLSDEKKPEPVAKTTTRYSGVASKEERPKSSSYQGGGGSYASGSKLFPSERMALRDTSSQVIMPKRAAVMVSYFSDADLEWMLDTPVKRGWSFSDWLEVIGLPRDLHEKHDSTIYPLMARTYLKRKEEAHRR